MELAKKLQDEISSAAVQPMMLYDSFPVEAIDNSNGSLYSESKRKSTIGRTKIATPPANGSNSSLIVPALLFGGLALGIGCYTGASYETSAALVTQVRSKKNKKRSTGGVDTLPTKKKKPVEPIKVPSSSESTVKSTAEEKSDVQSTESTARFPSLQLHEERVLIQGRKKKERLLRFENGDLYQGELNGLRRHGFGTFFESNGTIYVGNWQDDKKEGEGILYVVDSTLEGQWSDGRFNDTEKAKITKFLHLIYEGGVRITNKDEFKPHGFGHVKTAKGNILIGKFLNGIRNGCVIVKSQDGPMAFGKQEAGSWKGMRKACICDHIQFLHTESLNGRRIFQDTSWQVGAYWKDSTSGEVHLFEGSTLFPKGLLLYSADWKSANSDQGGLVEVHDEGCLYWVRRKIHEKDVLLKQYLKTGKGFHKGKG